jgi:hypothetical protein
MGRIGHAGGIPGCQVQDSASSKVTGANNYIIAAMSIAGHRFTVAQHGILEQITITSVVVPTNERVVTAIGVSQHGATRDAQLLEYSDMPREEFEKQVAANKIVKFQGQLHEFPADFTDEQIATALKSAIKNPWVSVAEAAAIAFGIPLAVLILRASVLWAFSGFPELT